MIHDNSHAGTGRGGEAIPYIGPEGYLAQGRPERRHDVSEDGYSLSNWLLGGSFSRFLIAVAVGAGFVVGHLL